MKMICALAVPALLADVTATTAEGGRRLIFGGETVPENTKTYTVGLRFAPNEPTTCAGALISPTHVLTSPDCVNATWPDLWASVGSHYIASEVGGEDDGELIKVVSVKIHPKFQDKYVAHGFAVLKLEKPSTFKPVQLADADDSDINKGKVVTSFGWGFSSSGESAQFDIQRMDVKLWGEEKCSSLADAVVCGSAGEGEGVCIGDFGNPLVVESESGNDSDDVLLGVLVGSGGCMKDPAIFSRVSAGRAWIDKAIKGKKGKHNA